MEYEFKPIPTKYKGRQYRSRLEARWAAYFDLTNIPFEYEPFDLDGWIPDFIINGETLVEIKPLDIKKELEGVYMIGDCRELLLTQKSYIFRKVLDFYLSTTDVESKESINLIPRNYDCILFGITETGYRFRNFRNHSEYSLFHNDKSWFIELLHSREKNGLNPIILNSNLTFYAGQSNMVEIDKDSWNEAANLVMYKKPK